MAMRGSRVSSSLLILTSVLRCEWSLAFVAPLVPSRALLQRHAFRPLVSTCCLAEAQEQTCTDDCDGRPSTILHVLFLRALLQVLAKPPALLSPLAPLYTPLLDQTRTALNSGSRRGRRHPCLWFTSCIKHPPHGRG